VTGAGSDWTSGVLYVGYMGSGTLTVEKGGHVGSGEIFVDIFAGYYGGRGSLTVRDGGTVTTHSLSAAPADLFGNGTIVANGAVLDADLVFDGVHGLVQSLDFGTGGKLNLNVDGTGSLGAGYKGTGKLRIAGGVSAGSIYEYLGELPNATGFATVSGAGSTWTSTWFFLRSGALRAEAGGKVVSRGAFQVAYGGGVGVATVTGSGSELTATNDSVYVGGSVHDGAGSGTLTVADGGHVSAWGLTLNSRSSLKVHVSGDNMIVLGNVSTAGSVANNGTVSFYADSFLPAQAYTPISDLKGRAMTWTGTGFSASCGGVWDGNLRKFTVSAATELAAGAEADVSNYQRLLFTGAGNQKLGASFGVVQSGTHFAADLMSEDELAALAAADGLAGQVLTGWDFDTHFGHHCRQRGHALVRHRHWRERSTGVAAARRHVVAIHAGPDDVRRGRPPELHRGRFQRLRCRAGARAGSGCDAARWRIGDPAAQEMTGMPLRHFFAAFASTFAHVSLSVTARLKTSAPGLESLSAQK
jgi:T5SS/PEP-CTERM-associated repeat protein